MSFQLGMIGQQRQQIASQAATDRLNGLTNSMQNTGFKSYLLSSSIQTLGMSVDKFSQPIDQLFGYFRTGLDRLTGIASQQFKKFGILETELLSSSNELRLSVTKTKYDKTPILSFDQSFAMSEQMRERMIKIATTMPGSNSDYLQAAKFTADLAGKSAKGDVSKVMPNWEKLATVTGLVGATQGINPSIVNTGINQFVAQGRLNNQSALGKKFPIFKDILNDPKMGATGNEQQRIDKLQKILPILFPKNVLDKFENTFDTRIANLNEQLFGETGIFSFSRKFDGLSVGDRLKKLFDKVMPDLTPLNKAADRLVARATAFLEPLATKVGGMLKGAPERLSGLKDFSPVKVVGALTGLTPDQNVLLINSVFEWLKSIVRGIGEALRGDSNDPIVKAFSEGIRDLFREIAVQKFQLTVANAPALAANDPLAALGVVSGFIQLITSVGLLIVGLSSMGGSIATVGGILTAAGTAVMSFGAAVMALPFAIPIAFALAAAAIVGIFYWIGSQVAKNWTAIKDFAIKSWITVVQAFVKAINFLNPVTAVQNTGKWLSGVVNGEPAKTAEPAKPAPAGTPPAGVFNAPPMVPASTPKKTEISLNVTDTLGTLNALTKDNLIDALGQALSGYGILSESPA